MDHSTNCPVCNHQLKHGYISSPRRISWSESGESMWADYENETLIKDSMFKIKKIPALRCEACHLVMFKHN